MFSLENSQKIYRRGTHRCASPVETLNKIEKFLPLFGITRVANITGLDEIGIPVVMATRPNSRSLAVSQGKGITLEGAKVSALMESIETFHAERIFLPSLFLSLDDMHYKYRITNISKVSRSKKRRLDSNSKILWHCAINLLDHEEIWIPYELLHTDFSVPSSIDAGYFISDTNGLASGNQKSEAINHALYEIIERDAVALWQASNQEQKDIRKIDPSSIDDPICQSLLKKFDAAGVAYALWDITTDINIPSFICKIISNEIGLNQTIRPAYGSGSHLNKNIALSRAITEAAQSRLTFIAGSRDDQYKKIYQSFLSQETLSSWHRDIMKEGKYKFSEIQEIDHETIEQDYSYIIKNLESIGVNQIICADLTRPEFNIPVVKIVVPGLESITRPDCRIYGQRMKNYMESRH